MKMDDWEDEIIDAEIIEEDEYLFGCKNGEEANYILGFLSAIHGEYYEQGE